MNGGYRHALLEVLQAIKEAQRVGCIEHVDCWDDAAEKWHGPIDRAWTLLNTPGGHR